MYIVPPCSEAQEFCQAVRENQLLGIIVNRSKKNETLPQQSNVNEGLAKLLSNPEIARRMAAIE